MRPGDAVDDPEQQHVVDGRESAPKREPERPEPAINPLDEIKRFKPGGTEDNKAAYSVPSYIVLGLESTVALLKARKWDMSIARVGLWAFTTGIRWLGALPAVREICDTREDLLRRGSSVTICDWRYSLSNRGERSVRLYLRYVDPADTEKASKLAIGLGLGQQSSGLVAALAVMSSLVELPLMGELPRTMERELDAFIETLNERRQLAANLRARDLAPAPSTPRRSWRRKIEQSR
jgi:hypothetical protein